jgi:hypothetical protein
VANTCCCWCRLFLVALARAVEENVKTKRVHGGIVRIRVESRDCGVVCGSGTLFFE